ncbi:hypothetical protein CPLU01_08402 [Colletotrichum plurivorum]|uniref:Uncharacterized protein n=1 Tax=Colletotrichum plurivorum TaxID=2175906 RepID=A0A8H6ND94_9PEZI|nr:hypothetical protein CPLU01_08402 [Colletotrichum plurivorum]
MDFQRHRRRGRRLTGPEALSLLLCLESIIVVGALVLFGAAYPDRLRSRLWRNGGEEGWCSNPRLRIYFYANYEEPPVIPLIWSQRLTTSNTAISILGLAIFFARITIAALRYEARRTNAGYDALLAVLWALSAAAQNGADLSDPEHLMERPWYLVHGCDGAWSQNRGWCRMAKWEYAWAIFAAVFYAARIVGTLGVVVYEKGRRDGKAADGEREVRLLDGWAWDWDRGLGHVVRG